MLIQLPSQTGNKHLILQQKKQISQLSLLSWVLSGAVKEQEAMGTS